MILDNIDYIDNREVVNTYNDDMIQELIYNKFKLIYNDNNNKIKYIMEDNTYKFEENIIKFVLLKLEKGKSLLWDYIPAESIKSLINNNDNNDNDKVIKN